MEFPPSRALGHSLLLGCLYRPPDKPIEDYCTALETTIAQIDLTTTEVILLGDFNATSPAWLSSDSYNSIGRVLEPTSHQLGLKHFVSFPTHLRNDAAIGGLCLDLVFCSSPALVKRISSVAPLGKSDHVMVQCVFLLQPAVCAMGQRLRRIWSYEKADFAELNKDLSKADWSSVCTAPDIDVVWSAWKRIV